MALRENERRILAEIEHRLSEDDPELAGRLSSFGEGDPSFSTALAGGGWRPWLVCGIIAVTVVGLLVVLFTLTPGAPADSVPSSPGTTEVVAPRTGVS
ncbi:DUF3040 domain-containing protein [Marinactinospora thermotolerans]|uniref:DUF3040 domain-containing protein n=1 Tax=Marinactinospora thermotolerans DSM 45154 TaxID=1122192 RepID=A0A1T4K9H0_9ACTN|nr:DUF3040 domain-containing protein [Marinactinospora thermotolerans]SJZ39046.1 Protein of unknown function [Marinactinospora thermotolerans DSM 45154]